MTVGLVPLADGHTSPWTRVAVINARHMPANVVSAFIDVADQLCAPEYPSDPVPAFMATCRAHAERLDPDGRLQFAILVGALFHELRHVHDLLGSMTGALLAMHWARVVGRAKPLVDLLTKWSWSDLAEDHRVPVPLDSEWLLKTFQDQSLVDILGAVRSELEGLSATWTRCTPPNMSIRDLYETNAYLTQLLVTGEIFGYDVAAAIESWIEDDRRASLVYTQALRYVFNHANFDLDESAIPVLIISALEEAAPNDPQLGFDDLKIEKLLKNPGQLPGPVRFYAQLALRLNGINRSGESSEAIAPRAVEEVVAADGGNPNLEVRRRLRSQALNDLRQAILVDQVKAAAGKYPDGLLALLVAELPVTYRDLVRLRNAPGQHDGRTWAAQVLNGEATAIAVRIHLPGGRTWNGRTRSPVGGAEDVAVVAEVTARQWQVLTQLMSLNIDPPEVLELRNKLIESTDREAGPRIRVVRRR